MGGTVVDVTEAGEEARGPTLVVHAHFYQPPRENPWTEELSREPGAEPYHDWNERITAECYRPNGHARVVDEHNRIVDIVNNYGYLSFDVGPTLASWFEAHEPEVLERIVDGDSRGRGGMAQAFFHVILPLAQERDVRTQVRWGLVEFEHRFGRPAEGLWLPETAVNDDVLAVLAEEGVRFTLLAPTQALAVRQLDADGDEWADVGDGSIDTSVPYRWRHPSSPDLGVDILFYDGGLSHAIAFEMGTLTSEALLDRMAGSGKSVVAVAADGETFGHHHRWADRMLAYAVSVEAPRRGMRVVSAAEVLSSHSPSMQVRVRESAWSCAHGVDRWRADCGCHTGGEPGWNQQWRAPLRVSLDIVREAVAEVFERRGHAVLRDPWAARDDYVRVLLDASAREGFVEEHVTGDRVEAFTLLEAERHAMAMYTSCGWFFNDLAGLETAQLLRYAARAADCLRELGEKAPLEEMLSVLEQAESNVATEGTGRDVWRRHVEGVRVGPDRVVAHLALIELLEDHPPPQQVAVWDVDVVAHTRDERGPLQLVMGTMTLTHRRTERQTTHTYAAIHLGALEVLGCVRDADPSRDDDVLARLRREFEEDAPLTTLLRIISDEFGLEGREFGLGWALPDAPEAILSSAARALADRFAGAYDRLFSDHRPVLGVLTQAGYPLPPVLRAPAELSLARRLEAEFAAQQGSLEPDDYARAMEIAEEARRNGFNIETPEARLALEGRIVEAVRERAVDGVVALLDLAARLNIYPSTMKAQEVAFGTLRESPDDEDVRRMAEALGINVARATSSGS